MVHESVHVQHCVEYGTPGPEDPAYAADYKCACTTFKQRYPTLLDYEQYRALRDFCRAYL
jgi:hypothetical protein